MDNMILQHKTRKKFIVFEEQYRMKQSKKNIYWPLKTY